jgi:hypothetical protein
MLRLAMPCPFWASLYFFLLSLCKELARLLTLHFAKKHGKTSQGDIFLFTCHKAERFKVTKLKFGLSTPLV